LDLAQQKYQYKLVVYSTSLLKRQTSTLDYYFIFGFVELHYEQPFTKAVIFQLAAHQILP